MTLLLACLFLFLHAAAIWFLPTLAMQASYAFLVGSPLLAFGVALRRCLREGWAHNRGWLLAALSMLLWTLGMLASLRQDLYLDNTNAAPGDSTLLFILYGVPIILAISASHVEGESTVVRIIDAALAMMLGYLFYVHTFSLLTMHGVSDRSQALQVVSMFDAENVFLLAASLLRLWASDKSHEFHYYRSLVVFTALYAACSFYYNRFVALGDHPDFGSLRDPIVDLPFLAFALLAWLDADPSRPRHRPSITLVRIVRSGAPMLMALALLVVAIVVSQDRFNLGMAGIVLAVVGYGARSTLTQVQHIQVEEGLLHQRQAFEELALTDSLTGLPNRRALDDALEREWQHQAHVRQSVALLMIDIDYFKQLNDRYGHPEGDACLRQISVALQGVLGRRHDVLGRWGGEEFALVMPGASRDAGLAVAERLRATVEHLAIANQDSPYGVVTISVGVSQSFAGDTPLDTLIASADSALYVAKHLGRNQVAVGR